MPFFNLIPRPNYHKNGTQWIGKLACAIIGERRYEWIRLEKRIFIAKYWYKKQAYLFKFSYQYPNVSSWFSILNKTDTSIGFPARRAYERYQDFAVFTVNSEGWFQVYFLLASIGIILWNYYVCAVNYDIKGVTVEDENLYRYKDAYMTMNFDRTKYNYNHYFFANHYFATVRHGHPDKDHPDDPRQNLKPQFGTSSPYGLDRYVKFYGHSRNMRQV